MRQISQMRDELKFPIQIAPLKCFTPHNKKKNVWEESKLKSAAFELICIRIEQLFEDFNYDLAASVRSEPNFASGFHENQHKSKI